MGKIENLKTIINQQKTTLSHLEAEYETLISSDTEKENVKLLKELEKLQTDYNKAKNNADLLADENKKLKSALYEEIYNEKVMILNATKKRLDIYFKSGVNGELDRLTNLENSVKSRIDNISKTLKKHSIDTKDIIYKKLDELSLLLNEKITTARANTDGYSTPFSKAEQSELEALKNEQITDKQINEITKKNNIERFVGLNLINSIGILLIIIGVITASRYTYFKLPDTLRGIMMFSLGGAMLLAGELINRKKANIFSFGITAGGIGVLYVALAVSYFGLKILSMNYALILCVLITATAFFLSTRYNSQTILAFALIGGYLPIFSIGADKTIVYAAMVYFVILNLLALLVSFKKNWSVASFIGLFLNIAGTSDICSKFNQDDNLPGKIILILYILFAFLNYTLIPIINTYNIKLKFRKRDIVLLAINTFFSSLIMYTMFYSFKWQDFTGTLAIIFAVLYLSLGWIIESRFSSEKNTQILFYLTGLTFVVLIIPFQFGKAWLTLGWLTEGLILTSYGILKEQKNFKRAGFVISGLCLLAFLFFDIFIEIDYLFAYKYLAITVGSLIILGAYMYKRTLFSEAQKFYKCAVIINLWFYIIYICGKLKTLRPIYYNMTYLSTALTIVLTFVIAYFTPRIKILSDLGTKTISIILYIVGILWVFVLNGRLSPTHSAATANTSIIGSIVIVLISLMAVFAMRDLIKFVVMERKLGIEWYPLIVSAHFVIILTQNLVVQYNLSFTSAWISIIYVATALLWIIFGFAKRYSFIRKFGLGLALLSVLKLFIIDLASLTKGYQIISYFSLGITLVIISFVYQYFSKHLELKGGASTDDKKNN